MSALTVKEICNEDRVITIAPLLVPGLKDTLTPIFTALNPSLSESEISDLLDTMINTGVGLWSGNGTFTDTLSSYVKENGKYLTLDNIAFSPGIPAPANVCTFSGFTFVSGTSMGIDATSSKCFDKDGVKRKIILKGDSGTCSGIFNNPTPPGGTFTCSCSLTVTDSGQGIKKSKAD